MPYTLKEPRSPLGVPYYKTHPESHPATGMSGILTGILLSVGQDHGRDGAAALYGLRQPVQNWNIFKPIDSLPYRIFYYAMRPLP